MAYLAYSNGANLLGAVLRLYPGTVNRAVLLCGIEVLEEPPRTDLTGACVLLLNGARDPCAVQALERSLRAGGAGLDVRTVAAGHELSPEALTIAANWMRG